VHIAEGLDAWRNGRFQQYNDHPPLARLLCTLPLLNPKWQVEVEQLPQSFRIPSISPDPLSLAWRARLVNAGLGMVLGVLVWFTAANLFSVSAANFALVLFAFSPSLIANFSVVTTDGAATLLIFASAWAIVYWKRRPSWKNTTALGFVLGLLLLSKFSTLLMFAVAVFWMLALVSGGISFRPWKWNWRKTAVAVGIAFLVLWAGYFFHVSHLTIRDGTLTVTFPNWTRPLVKPNHSGLNFTVPIPAGEFVAGFRDLAIHNAHGQPAFFLGRTSSSGGWKSYYPVTILLKWPILVVALALTGLLLTLLKRVEVSGDLWIMASFPAVYFLVAIFAHFNLGERHILALYPFALLFAAAVWQQASFSGTGAYSWGCYCCGMPLMCCAPLLDTCRISIPSFARTTNIVFWLTATSIGGRAYLRWASMSGTIRANRYGWHISGALSLTSMGSRRNLWRRTSA